MSKPRNVKPSSTWTPRVFSGASRSPIGASTADTSSRSASAWCRSPNTIRTKSSAYAELWIMPASSEYLLVKSGRSSYGVGIILRVCRRPGFLVRVSDSSGQEDDHGDEHGSRRRSSGRGQHGAAGGVRQVAGPGAGPVAGVGAVLFQA